MVKSRSIAGKQAFDNGKAFEHILEDAANRKFMGCTRVPNSCRRVSAKKLIQIKSPFDFLLSYRGKTALVDAKSTGSDTFNNSAICQHQLDEFQKHHINSVLTGYVVYLRNDDLVYFIPYSLLSEATRGLRGSIRPDYPGCIYLGNQLTMDLRLIFGHGSRISLPTVDDLEIPAGAQAAPFTHGKSREHKSRQEL